MPELLHTFTDGACDKCDRHASIHDRTGLCEDCYADEQSDGYCKHGTYVGGCMEDWICHWCEMGE